MSRLVEEFRRVLFVGSSTTAPGGTGPSSEGNRYTSLVQAARPNDVYTVNGIGGTLVEDWIHSATAAGTSLANNYFIASDAEAANFSIGQYVQIYTSDTVLKEQTAFTITSMPSTGGFTNITFSPSAAALPASGNLLRRAYALTPCDVGIVQLGINDWYVPVDADTFQNQVRIMLSRLRLQSPSIELFWLRAWMPNSDDASRIQTWNDYEEVLKELVNYPGPHPFTLMDMRETNRSLYWYDPTGFHYNDHGHLLLAKKVLEYL